jgi:hypothetical protein
MGTMVGAATQELPKGDYVSPGLERILLDAHFPNMIKVTNPVVLSQMDILKTRALHHNHYADKRHPTCGVNRDEAHILYNTALRYKDKNALEIGCWLGWSACHLLASGIRLDVIDPILKQDKVRESVIASSGVLACILTACSGTEKVPNMWRILPGKI